MKLTDIFSPLAILAETHFPYLGEDGAFADAMERVVELGFYKGIEIRCIHDTQERRRIRQIAQEHNLHVAVWPATEQAAEGLSLSSLDESHRKASVKRFLELLDAAAKYGAGAFSLISDPDPGEPHREQAMVNLQESICQLCRAAAGHEMLVIAEPFDRGAHKNGLLGPIDEACDLFEAVRQRGHSNFGMSWDTSHVSLNGEDLHESLLKAWPYVVQVHIANPVLDRSRNDFGDYHIPIGPPGFMTIERVASVMRDVIQLRSPGAKPIFFTVEVRTQPDGDPWETEKHCRDTVQAAWRLVEQAGSAGCCSCKCS